MISALSGSMVLACYVDSLSLRDVLFVLATSHCTQCAVHNGTDDVVVKELTE